MYYDSIYECPDKPPAHVIDNDDLIDKWYEKKINELEANMRESNRNNKSSVAYDYDEVIVFSSEAEEYGDEEEYSNGSDVTVEGCA
jgi:hypothetical protein